VSAYARKAGMALKLAKMRRAAPNEYQFCPRT
jgi:hypothetical protein